MLNENSESLEGFECPRNSSRSPPLIHLIQDESMASAWPRPSSAPLPMVYRRFKGPRPMPDGRTPNFWIQDITPDQDEQIVDFMSDGFLKEEFMCSRSGLPEDPVSLQEIRDEWRQRLKHRAGLVALTDWPDGPHNPRIAGCNVTYITRRGDPLIK
ncbi:Putative acetyltransferase, partial [Gryllus bimaculatus]